MSGVKIFGVEIKDLSEPNGETQDQKRAAEEAQLADKGISTIKMTKSFRPPFSKGGAVEAAEASSPSAEGEIPLSALLFCELFSCAYIAKRKAANSFVLFNKLLFL